ncbi:hypothetical protein HCA58_20090 [Micromonospora sp. HNM0581]|uniref:hypothetical protein n=1 Tax=Micromonospora sp. HNM0581 TaxID=2716341 RepID=UPI00146DE551|nr:hypothetical protein [Micromonospora sp. HNM0581]NLU80625.1 hypothetical protein [Micromonospora sp. HNM0581]
MGSLESPAQPGTGRHRTEQPRILRGGLVGTVWLASGAVAYTLDDNLLALSVLSTLFGGWVFWNHGGSRITAVGVYNLAFALFVGFAGIYLAADTADTDPGVPLLTVQAVCYASHVVTWLIFWSRPVRHHTAAISVNGPTATWAVAFGAVLLAIAIAGSAVVGPAAPLVKPSGFVGVVLVAAGLFLGPLGRWTVLCGSLTTAAFGVYFTFLFSGYGRIVIGSLALALLAVFAQRYHRRYAKMAVILGAAPVLLFLASIRAGGPATTVDSDGFGSAVSPLASFASLWQMSAWGVLPNGSGSTFWATAVALFPRSLWPDKPVGFGAEIVPFLSPHLAGTDHSAAALWHGEWLYNFGPAGIVAMVPVTGVAVRGIDWVLTWATSHPLDTPAALAGFVGAVLGSVGLFDLLWVGSFTVMGRTGARLLVLMALVAVAGWIRMRPTASTGRGELSFDAASQVMRAGAPPAAIHVSGYDGYHRGWEPPNSHRQCGHTSAASAAKSPSVPVTAPSPAGPSTGPGPMDSASAVTPGPPDG